MTTTGPELAVGVASEDWADGTGDDRADRATDGARYFEYTAAADPIRSGHTPRVPVVSFPSSFSRSHPSGVECIDVAEHYGFSIGNAIKYLWRAGLKGDAIEDLKKARWYIDREIQKRSKGSKTVNKKAR